ncbi:hypothetical protein [Granulicella arctica]|uniref:Glutathionylspermidine synthase n=1 Tax=Granulicella arctica TaxID=940613 RepID=A0A7Y9PIS6_9BACT|nr:hypothetical protein [Granulicella arctica]NYF80535.1 hypothetical protein [Granulicella arctica]
MLEPFRSDFNARFTSEKYQELLTRLDVATRTKIDFRVSETPCFLPKALLDEMAEIGAELTHQLVGNPAYMAASAEAVPERFRVPGESEHPHFMTVDFGLVRSDDGGLQPKLVELQAFPSVFGYQSVLTREYIETYGLDTELQWLLGGLDEESYWALLRRVILGDHAAENVVLTEIAPETQKTLPDFHVYEDRLGIATVDIASLRKEGKRLFYQRDGRWIPISRIYNRAIVDEMERKNVQLGFDYRDELEVEWAGHPNWYFRISKFSLPFLKHPAVPATVFLDEWFREGEAKGLPMDRERVLLKPLYSFAGRGIQFAPSDEELASIPPAERHLYLLQERVQFEPAIETPHGKTQAEVRIMYLWPDGGELTPAISLVRMGRGLMMGVDHNKDQEWVGGSAGLFPVR